MGTDSKRAARFDYGPAWRRGYQEGLRDIQDAYDRGGEAEVLAWLRNNRRTDVLA